MSNDDEGEVVYMEVTCRMQMPITRLPAYAKVEIPGWGSVSFMPHKGADGKQYIDPAHIEGLREEHGDELVEALKGYLKNIQRSPVGDEA